MSPGQLTFQSPAEQLLFTTVYIEAAVGSGRKSIGTGFMYTVELDDGRPVSWLVTNKHVLAEGDPIRFRMIRDDGSNNPHLGAASEVNVARAIVAQLVVEHPDPQVDVAVMAFEPLVQQMRSEGQAPFFITIPHELAMTETSGLELDALEEVVFVGYPNGLFDTANLTPVFRRGTTASHPAMDYRGEPAFLIDASVFPGSSGSPVLIANQGSYSPKSGGLVAGNRVVLLGVLAAVHLREATGEIVPAGQLDAAQRVQFDDPLNLGIVYKASAINECIDGALASQGLKRRDPDSKPAASSDPSQVAPGSGS